MTRVFVLLTSIALLTSMAMSSDAQGQPAPAPKQTVIDDIAPELRRVYIPSDQLDAIFNRDRQGVVLSREEFRKLYAAAKNSDLKNPLPSESLVYAKADYVARISGQHLLITAKLHFTHFVEGWRILRLPLRGLSVEKAMLDDSPARIGRNPRDTSILELMVDATGDHVLSLDLSAPLAAVGSDKVSAFGLPNISVAQLSLTLPAGKHLIANSVALQRSAPVDQPADYNVTLGGKSELTLRITERGEQQVTDSLVFANTDFVVDVAPGEISWQAKTRLNVFGKPLDRLVFSVPNSLEIAEVASTGQEAWELADANNGPRTDIIIDYRQPFQDAREITIKGISSPREDGRWSVPDLKLTNVTSHTSRIVVRHPLGTRLRTVAETGVRTAEATPRNRAPLPTERNLVARVFEAWQEDFVLTFETQPKEREILAKVNSALMVNQSNVELQSLITLATLYAPLFEVEVQLPADWTVESVQIGGQRLEWRLVPKQAGLHSVRIELPTPLEPQQTREITLRAHRILDDWDADAADQKAEFPLPEVLLPDASVSDGTYTLRAAENLDIVALDVRGLDPVSHGANGERAAYRFQDSRFAARIEVSRKPSSVTTECLVHSRLDQDLLRSHFECAVDMQGGGLRNLEVAVSAAVGDRARFQVASDLQIVEQKFDREAQIDGHSYRVWKLRFDRRLTGRHVIVTDVEVPRPADGAIDAPKLRVLTAERESGFVVIEASGEQQLTITARDHRDRELAEVDQVDVIGSEAGYRPRERVVATYRFVNGHYSVSLAETRFEKSAVPTAVCHSLAIKSVLAKNGDMQNRVVAEFSAIGVQGIRVQLPDDATLWSTVLDGSPVVVRKLDNKYLVPLSGGDSESTRTLALFYRSRLNNRMEGTGSIEQAPPQITVDVGGDEQPLEVLDQSWTMDYPRDLHLTNSTGRFEPVSPLVRTDLLSFFQQSLSIPTARRATNTAFSLAIICAVVLVFWACFRKWQVKGAIACLAVGGTAFAVFVLTSLQLASPNASMSTAVLRDATPTTMAERGAMAMDDAEFDMSRPNARYGGGAGMGGMPMTQGESGSDPFLAGNSETSKSGEKAPMEGIANFKSAAPAPPGGISGKRDSSIRAEKPGFAAVDPGSPFGANSPGDSPGGPPTTPTLPGRNRPDASSVGLNQDKPRAVEEIDVADVKSEMPSKLAPTTWDVSPRQLGGLHAEGRDAARLSINIDVEQPEDHISHSFHYRGIQTADAGGLRIEYQSRESGTGWQLVCLAAVLGVFWVLRNRSTGFKAILAVVGFSLPLALIGLLPVGLHSMLQGSWVGALAGLVLWGIRNVSVCLTKWRTKSNRKLATAMVLLGVAIVGSEAFAQNAQPIADPFGQPGGQPPNPATQSVDGPQQIAPLQSTPQQRSASQRSASQRSASQRSASQRSAQRSAGAVDRQPETLIIPYDIGTDPLASEHVFLSRGQFLELWNKAHPEQRIKASSPVDGLVTAAVFSAQLADDEAGLSSKVIVTGRLLLHSFRDGQVLLPLPMGVVALDSATLDGKPAALTARSVKPVTDPSPNAKPSANNQSKTDRDQPTLHVILESAGTHVLDVKFSLAAKRTGPAGQFTLPLHPVASGRLSFQLPEKDLSVRINGASSIFRRRDIGEQQLVEVATDRGGNLTVAWQPKTARGAVDSVVLANGHSLVQFTDAGVKWLSAYDVSTRQGSLSELTFSLPEPLKVQGIAGPDVGGWELLGAGAQRSIRVFLRRKITDQTKVFFSLHHPLIVGDKTAKFELPEFAPREVTRETGTTGFFTEDQFVLQPAAQTRGQINVGEFARASAILNDATLKAAKFEQPNSQPKFAYRYAARPFNVSVNIERRKAATEVSSIHGARIETRKVHWTSLYRFNLKGTPRSRLVIYLPDDYVLLEADSQYLSEWFPHENPDFGRVVILELNEPRLGNVEVTLNGVVSRDPNEEMADLWLPEPLDIDKATTRLAVWVDDSYSAVESEIDGWQTMPPDQLSARHRAIYATAPQFALKSDELEISTVAYKLTRIAPRVKADVLTVINLTEVSIEYSFNVRWSVKKGLADRFSLTAPDTFAGRLRFTAPGLRQVKESKTADGRTRWELTIQQPTRTAFFAQAAAVLPPVDDTFITPGIDIESAPVGAAAANFVSLGKESQRQYVVLVNQSRDVVESVNENAVEDVRDADLPEGLAISAQLLEQASEKFRLRTGRPIPEWRVLRRKQDQGDAAVIRLASLNTVIAADGSWRTKAAYTMTNQSRQFLAVELPEKSRLLAVVVQGKPSRAVVSRNDKNAWHLIPLPVTSVTDPTFNVELVLAGMSDGGISTDEFQLLGQKFRLPAPKIATPEDSPEWGVSVMRSSWNVYVPDDWNVTTDKESGWTAAHQQSPTSVATHSAKVTGQVEKFKIIDNSQSTPRQRFEWYDNAREVLREGAEAQEELPGDSELTSRLQDLKQQVTEFEAGNTLDASGRNAYSKDLFFNNFNLDVRGQRLNVDQQNRDLLQSNAPGQGTNSGGEERDRRFRFQLDLKEDNKQIEDETVPRDGKSPAKPNLRSKQNFRDQFRNAPSQGQGKGGGMIGPGTDAPANGGTPGGFAGMQSKLQLNAGEATDDSKRQQRAQRGGQFVPNSGLNSNRLGQNESKSPDVANSFGIPNDMNEDQPPGNSDQFENQQTTRQAWKSAGGLSLKIDIPTSGQVFTFTRMSAAPEIVLSIQPRESANSVFGGIWAVVWVIGGIACLVLIQRVGPTGLMQAIPFVLVAFGLFASFAFPEAYATIGIISFGIGVTWLAVLFRSVGNPASI